MQKGFYDIIYRVIMQKGCPETIIVQLAHLVAACDPCFFPCAGPLFLQPLPLHFCLMQPQGFLILQPLYLDYLWKVCEPALRLCSDQQHVVAPHGPPPQLPLQLQTVHCSIDE